MIKVYEWFFLFFHRGLLLKYRRLQLSSDKYDRSFNGGAQRTNKQKQRPRFLLFLLSHTNMMFYHSITYPVLIEVYFLIAWCCLGKLSKSLILVLQSLGYKKEILLCNWFHFIMVTIYGIVLGFIHWNMPSSEIILSTGICIFRGTKMKGLNLSLLQVEF